jgi:hypothetical protein
MVCIEGIPGLPNPLEMDEKRLFADLPIGFNFAVLSGLKPGNKRE